MSIRHCSWRASYWPENVAGRSRALLELSRLPTLRPDGSLLATEGYDQRSELYLMSSLKLPPIPERPSKEQALEALEHLTDLFCEFSFSDKEGKKRLNQSVALSGLLTASVRGSYPLHPSISFAPIRPVPVKVI